MSKKTYLERLGIPHGRKTIDSLQERILHLETGIAEGTWKGTLLEKAQERVKWFRGELKRQVREKAEAAEEAKALRESLKVEKEEKVEKKKAVRKPRESAPPSPRVKKEKVSSPRAPRKVKVVAAAKTRK